MRKRVVVMGSSPFASSLAALVAAREAEVVLVLEEHREDAPPWDLGASRVAGGQEEAALRLAWGEVDRVEDDRRLALGGDLLELPLGRRSLARSLPDRRAALGDLARVRLKRRMGRVVALGREVRTYEDWVVDRLGRGLYEGLFCPWARKRFAAEPAELPAVLAYQEHGLEAAGPWLAPRRPWAQVLAGQLESVHRVVRGQGTPVLEGGRVVALEVDGERIEADVLLADAALVTATGWLGEAGPREQWELERLDAAHAVQITLPAAAEHLPWVTHVPDPERPFWRLSRPGQLPGQDRWRGHLTAHLSLDEADPLWQGEDEAMADAVRRALVGLADPQRGEAVVQRQPLAVPRPVHTTPVALGRRLEALDTAGIGLVGSRGVYRLVQPAAALAYADALWEGPTMGQRAVHRDALEREVRLPDEASPRLFSTA